MDFSPVQLIIVLVIVLLLFGAKKLPEIGRNLGRGAREFKDGITGKDEERPEHIAAAPNKDEERPEPIAAAPNKDGEHKA